MDGDTLQEPQLQEHPAAVHIPDDVPQEGTAHGDATPDTAEASSRAEPEPEPADAEGGGEGGAGEDGASGCDEDAADVDFYAATFANLIQHPLLHVPQELADSDQPTRSSSEQSYPASPDHPQATPAQPAATSSDNDHAAGLEQPDAELPASTRPPNPASLSKKMSSTSPSSCRGTSPSASKPRGPSPARSLRTTPNTATAQPSTSSSTTTRFSLRPSSSPDMKQAADTKPMAKRAMDRMPTFKGVPVSEMAPFEAPVEFEKEDGKWYSQYMKAVISKHKEKGGGWSVPMRPAASVPARFRRVEMQPPSEMEDARLLDMPKPALHTAFQAYLLRHAAPGRASASGEGRRSSGGGAEQQRAPGSRRSAGGNAQAVRSSLGNRELPHHEDKLQRRNTSPHSPSSSLPARGATAPSPASAAQPRHSMGPLSVYQAKKRKEEKQHKVQLFQRHHEQRAREAEALRQDLQKHSRWSSSCLPQQHVGPPAVKPEHGACKHAAPSAQPAAPVPGLSLSASAALCLAPRRQPTSPAHPHSPRTSLSSPPHSPRLFDLKSSGLQNRMHGYPSGDSYTFSWACSMKEPQQLLSSRSLLPSSRHQRI